MKRCLTASPLKFALSAALALALSVTPVSAGSNNQSSNDNDAAAFIGALIGLATIGVLLSNNSKRDEQVVQPYRRKPQDRYYPKRRHKQWSDVRRVPKHLQLPAHCVKTYRTQQGKHKFFKPRCLKRNFSHASSLPRACKDTIVARNNQGKYVARKVYRGWCLHNRGYRTKTYY